MSNPVEPEDIDVEQLDDAEDLPVDRGQRRGAVARVGEDVGDLLASLTSLPPLDDVEAWAKREADQRERNERAAAVRAAGELERRATYLRSEQVGWPARLVDDAVAADVRRPLVARVASLGRPQRGQRHLLVLEGGVGTGKSTAATWWALRFGGATPVYLRSATFEGEGRYDRAVRARLGVASAIVLDDLGAEYADGKGNFLAALEELIDVMYSSSLPAIICTNLTRDAFEARYGGPGGRIRSRLRSAGAWTSTAGTDLRR